LKKDKKDSGQAGMTKNTEHLPATEVLTPVEWPFKEYMQLSNDIDQLGQQMEWLLIQDARSHFMKGVILTKVKQNCKANSQTFGNFLSQYCGGMSWAGADNYMRFARQCAELKTVREFAEGNWSKVISLMNRMTEDQIADADINGIDGKPLLEYSLISARDFDKIIKELTGKLKDAEKNAESKLGHIVEAMRLENEGLKKRLPPPHERDKYTQEKLKNIAIASTQLSNLLDDFAEDPHVTLTDGVKAAIKANADIAYMRAVMFYEKYAAKLGLQLPWGDMEAEK
jgi:regulator of replication initiation timing